MKHIVVFCLIALTPLILCSNVAKAADMPICTKAQQPGYQPSLDDIAAHRQFELPVVRYPFGTQRDAWGMALTLRVDASGHVTCYQAQPLWMARNQNPAMNELQKKIIDDLGAWRYQPFVRDGQPVDATIAEYIAEEEIPQTHLPLPQVPLAQVHITLSRSTCFGTCPSYRVDIDGTGSVTYHGDSFVDVIGEHRYTIPTTAVKALVDSMRSKNLWSLRTAYRSTVTDNPTQELTLTMGGQAHHIEDYVGPQAGMPIAVSEFESEIDHAANTAMFVRLSVDGVRQLQNEGFDFHSSAAADLLARAVTNERGGDDQAMLMVIQLGVPLDGHTDASARYDEPQGSVLEEALKRHRSALITPLIARGALLVEGKLDQRRIDAAFQAAIIGGRLASVQTLWNLPGHRQHPALYFQDNAVDGKNQKYAPVSVLLSRSTYPPDDHWQGLAIAKLSAKGCDLKASRADGDTLLHIAAKARDADFVRYLVAQGLDPSARGELGLLALDNTQSEDVALILLQAGTNLSLMTGKAHQFRTFAEDNHWQRVVAWLEQHHID